MTKLKSGKKIERELRVDGVDKPVYCSIEIDGLFFWAKKGAKKKLFVPWSRVVGAGLTPSDVPSFLMDRPLEMLRHQAAH
jgi:hypothetical protein